MNERYKNVRVDAGCWSIICTSDFAVNVLAFTLALLDLLCIAINFLWLFKSVSLKICFELSLNCFSENVLIRNLKNEFYKNVCIVVGSQSLMYKSDFTQYFNTTATVAPSDLFCACIICGFLHCFVKSPLFLE
jgi:hypothetical protein